MTLESTATGPVSVAALAVQASDEHYFARFGTFLLNIGKEASDKKAIYAAISTEVRRDARVSEVQETDLRPDWSHPYWYFPPRVGSDEQLLLGGGDAFRVFYFESPLVFEVKVPIKNQPLFRHESDVPTDTYWVCWDGVTAFVMWAREPLEQQPAKSAGHVVVDVLSSAAVRAGFSLVEQPCSPGCTNRFAHTELRVTRTRGADEVTFSSSSKRVVDCMVSSVDGPGPYVTVTSLWSEMAKTSRLFSAFKNRARRLVDLEYLARKFVGKLLEYDYRRIGSKGERWWRRSRRGIRNLFVHRQDGYSVKQIMASLWLTMLSIETVRRDALRDLDKFQDSATRPGAQDVFEIDLRDDTQTVTAIDVQFIRAAVEQKSTRVDSRWVIVATFASAAAALIAAFIGTALGAVAAGHS